MSANRLKLNPEKTELLWSGSRHSLRKLGCVPTIQARHRVPTDNIKACGQVRLPGVIMSSDLSLEKHASAVCAACFFHLMQIRRVLQSLNAESAATLVHAFVTSRVDHCNAVLAGSPKVTTDKLQTLLPASLATLGSSIAVCRGYCTTNSTGSLSPTEYN